MQQTFRIWIRAVWGFQVFADAFGNDFVNDLKNQLTRFGCLKRFVAECVNHFALLVHDIVKIERAFADLVVSLLDPFLRSLDALIEPRMLEFFAILQSKAFHHRGHPFGSPEVPHQIIFETHVKSG